MENSRCVQHRKQVREIFGREETDIGVACAMLRDQMGWHFPDGKDTEITAFTRFLNDMDGEEVRKYFAEQRGPRKAFALWGEEEERSGRTSGE